MEFSRFSDDKEHDETIKYWVNMAMDKKKQDVIDRISRFYNNKDDLMAHKKRHTTDKFQQVPTALETQLRQHLNQKHLREQVRREQEFLRNYEKIQQIKLNTNPTVATIHASKHKQAYFQNITQQKKAIVEKTDREVQKTIDTKYLEQMGLIGKAKLDYTPKDIVLNIGKYPDRPELFKPKYEYHLQSDLNLGPAVDYTKPRAYAQSMAKSKYDNVPKWKQNRLLCPNTYQNFPTALKVGEHLFH